MPFSCSPSIPNVFDVVSERPWEIAVPPFQVAPRTYYVSGQRWVGSYLIDTGDGCILVDIALPSHPNQIEIMDRAGSYTDEAQPYLDAGVWAEFLAERVRQVREAMGPKGSHR